MEAKSECFERERECNFNAEKYVRQNEEAEGGDEMANWHLWVVNKREC